ncbi:hypothetical protein [Allorhizobium taibaishanense]|uniref:Uncharacterized protein n=1 Tax=Allorhizobium taibaishanense TaxID=887144 RepID=A0A1Q9ABM6_9HYPH|nr:hypothetical protein [Allorhizobium taibaishanense]MBB4010636.1 hypothetical protein [Allorhizobium taibaishanense]OLP52265.1 hypothetical protein BJF91_24045 [Allorhizobium taibaishanense]
MVSFAAIMVIVACHPERADCLKQPVAVINYGNLSQCQTALPVRLRQLDERTLKLYGDCIPVSADLVAGKIGIRSMLSENQKQDFAKGSSNERQGSGKTVSAVALDDINR